MLPIPQDLASRFERRLQEVAVPHDRRANFKKWLRYYLDFCNKYHFPVAEAISLPPFLAKLEKKNQTTAQRQEASCAIALLYQILGEKPTSQKPAAAQAGIPVPATPGHEARGIDPRSGHSVSPAPQPFPATGEGVRATRRRDGECHAGQPSVREDSPSVFRSGNAPALGAPPPAHLANSSPFGPTGVSVPETRPTSAPTKPQPTSPPQESTPPDHFNPSAGPQRSHNGRGASWEAEFSKLKNEIKLRHYSPKTLNTYTGWVRKFQAFTKSKQPVSLSTDDVKGFLTFLAVRRKVSSSTQNQAFNALLFFYRHVLGVEFGEVHGVVRAKRKPYVPVVLSREEIGAVVAHLQPPYDLVVKLLYGCGLRLFECLNLRVHCFNFDARVLTVHDGK